MRLDPFTPFIGQHCETTATGTLLRQRGITLSEPMLFGIGEGLGFGYFDFKTMPFPFIGGRPKPYALTQTLCHNLGLTLTMKETTSRKKAWANVSAELELGNVVGLQLDSFHLDYFSDPVHFAGHFVAMYGADETNALLVDTQQQGSRATTSLESLALARSEKGPMAAKNRSYTIAGAPPDVLEPIVTSAIKRNADVFLNPPIKNLGYKGMLKASVEVPKWFSRSRDRKSEFQTSAMLMERAGTGGSLFRNFYRDFLGECAERFGLEAYGAARAEYAEIAALWRDVASRFHQAGATGHERDIAKASALLAELSERERVAMSALSGALS